jgi:hypothetical protein
VSGNLRRIGVSFHGLSDAPVGFGSQSRCDFLIGRHTAPRDFSQEIIGPFGKCIHQSTIYLIGQLGKIVNGNWIAHAIHVIPRKICELKEGVNRAFQFPVFLENNACFLVDKI